MYWYMDGAPRNVSASQLQTRGALRKKLLKPFPANEKKKMMHALKKKGAGPLIVRGFIYRAKAELCPLM